MSEQVRRYTSIVRGLSWDLSTQTQDGEFISWLHGSPSIFGGRSTMWFGWSPQPTPQDMRGWPKITVERAFRNFDHANKLLNVVPTDRIDSNHMETQSVKFPTYGVMQKYFISSLKKRISDIPTVDRVEAARFSVEGCGPHKRHSTPGKLLALVDNQEALAHAGKGAPLSMVARCSVDAISQRLGRATVLATSRGDFHLGNADLVLAMGTMETTKLVANSFPDHIHPTFSHVGGRFTAHFASNIVARCPREIFGFNEQVKDWEMAALYLPAMVPQTQGLYHVQLLALSDKNPKVNAKKTFRQAPEFCLKTSARQRESSGNHVVVVATPMGGMDHRNKNSWFRKSRIDDEPGHTLQVVANENDLFVWDTMDNATFHILERLMSAPATNNTPRMEYWIGDPEDGEWQSNRPPGEQIRRSAVMHEGSTLWIGDEADQDAPVDTDYRLRGAENVYITGGALWPTGGSWNPTLTMVALAQDLADHLNGCRDIPLGKPAR